MLILRSVLRDYAWGRIDGMVPLVGASPTGGPEAELWVGAHPGAPATVVGDDRTLAEVIAEDPAGSLGVELAAKGVRELPFLMKVLAVGRPLSLQAHPSAAQAEAGYAREESDGVAMDDPTRTYRDPNPKPEALVALAPTWAMCGFRTGEVARSLVEALAVPGTGPLLEALDGPEPLVASLRWLLGPLPREADLCAGLAETIRPDPAAALDPSDPSSESNTRAWVARLQAAFPGDPTALAPVLVDVIRLEVGEAVHLPAGNLHAYLDGAGVEIMAASDNVLRGGLTEKHVDVDELIRILRFDPGVPDPPVFRRTGRLTVYDASESSFSLGSIEPGSEPAAISATRPSLLLATGGPVELAAPDGTRVILDGGRAAFLPAGSPTIEVTGPGRLWWATTGDGHPI